MTKFVSLLATFAVLWTSIAEADDAKVSFTFNVGLVKVSITGVSQAELHSAETKKMLKRVAQLAHYSILQLKQQQNFPDCLERGPAEEAKKGEFFVSGPCLRWEE